MNNSKKMEATNLDCSNDVNKTQRSGRDGCDNLAHIPTKIQLRIVVRQDDESIDNRVKRKILYVKYLCEFVDELILVFMLQDRVKLLDKGRNLLNR